MLLVCELDITSQSEIVEKKPCHNVSNASTEELLMINTEAPCKNTAENSKLKSTDNLEICTRILHILVAPYTFFLC